MNIISEEQKIAADWNRDIYRQPKKAKWIIPNTTIPLEDCKTLLDVKQLAKILSVSNATVRDWIYKKSVPFIRVTNGAIRFDPKAVLEWLDERKEYPR